MCMSEIKFNCKGCEADLFAPEILLGAEIRCDNCETKQIVPDPAEEASIDFFCAGCGTELSVAEEYKETIACA